MGASPGRRALAEALLRPGAGRARRSPGDLAIFDWDGGLPDHVGIVIRADASEPHTVEGNTAVGNDSDGGEVMRRTRGRAPAAGFGRV